MFRYTPCPGQTCVGACGRDGHVQTASGTDGYQVQEAIPHEERAGDRLLNKNMEKGGQGGTDCAAGVERLCQVSMNELFVFFFILEGRMDAIIF